MLNFGSLLLGIIAWVAPIWAMRDSTKETVNRNIKFVFISLSACILSLSLQILEINHRVQVQDWSTLLDTIGTLKWVVIILVAVTLILNMFALVMDEEEVKD